MSIDTGYIQNDTELTGPFAAALAEGKLIVQKCNDCSALIMYPKYRCPLVLQRQPRLAAGGRRRARCRPSRSCAYGPPSSFAVEAPYGIGIVKLDEGPQLMCRLQPGPDGTWDHYVCDQRVSFSPADPAEIAERAAAWFTAA